MIAVFSMKFSSICNDSRSIDFRRCMKNLKCVIYGLWEFSSVQSDFIGFNMNSFPPKLCRFKLKKKMQIPKINEYIIFCISLGFACTKCRQHYSVDGPFNSIVTRMHQEQYTKLHGSYFVPTCGKNTLKAQCKVYHLLLL